ncbi:MAG: signal peptide peptidase SppA [Bacteroidota bacterium]
MGNFFKTVFASCLGVFLAGFALFFFFSFIIGQAANNLLKGPEAISANSILTLSFDEEIPERTNNTQSGDITFANEAVLGLHDIVGAIEYAQTDDKIKGILLDLGTVSIGRASNKVVREALMDFKTSGKFILAYSQYYNQSSYYLASVADEILVHPLGNVDFLGYSAELPFFKDLLDRMDVKVQVFYAGQYKSATEPFRRKDMSPQNRVQIREYLEDMYALYLNDIAEAREVSTTKLRQIADQYLLRKTEDAIQYNLVDKAAYRDELIDNMKGRLGLDDSDQVNMVTIEDYGKKKRKGAGYSVSEKIAVVYAEGTIVDGKGQPGNTGGDKYARIIRKLRQQANVKAIVLRVNSPGGSVMASDVMWRELVLAKEQGIPIVASFSDYAASGGYYIACMADSIFAEPNSITGSIGVFAMFPSLQRTFNNHLGITMDTVKTGPFSNHLSMSYDISAEESAIMQKQIEDFYETFLGKVAKSRNMTRDEVHAIAQGRVWTGKKALELGLVDAIGGIDEAIASAASLADLDQYRVTEYPQIKNRFERMILEFTNEEARAGMVKSQIEEAFPNYKYLMELKEMKGAQARLPFMELH